MKEIKILLTGAGGPAAICAFKSLTKENYYMHMADMDPLSAGLYMVEKEQRHVILPAANSGFVDNLLSLCANNKITYS